MFKRKKRKRKVRNTLSVSMPTQRANQRFRRRIILLVFGVILLGALGYGVHLGVQEAMNRVFYENDEYALEFLEIKVSGNISRAEIRKWSGVQAGQNLMSLDLDQIRENLLRIPNIGEVVVARRLPNTLQISVEERQPVALLKPRSRNGFKLVQEVYYMDREGVVIRPKPGERLKRLPVITGIDSDMVVEGSRVDHTETMGALHFIDLCSMSRVTLSLDLTEIDVSSRGYLITRTRNRGYIRFCLDYLDQQLDRLKVIFDYAERNGKVVKTVDLSPERNVPVTFF